MMSIRHAFAFLTIIPLPFPSTGDVDEKDLGGSSAFFPLVGLAQGLSASFAFFLLNKAFSPGVTATLLVTGFVVFSGGLHIDGLSDTFDALASRKNRKQMLALMKDSCSGPVGTAGVVLVLLLKILLLKDVFEHTGSAYFCLTMMPVVGKWSMVAALTHGKSARREGLGRIFIEHTGIPQFAVATSLTVLILVLVAGWGGMSSKEELVMSAGVLLAVYLAGRFLLWFFHRRFHGLTGDHIGALNEISEVLFLLAALPLLTA
jgi:adenosylcobinamide-GDP ribazoletransferase